MANGYFERGEIYFTPIGVNTVPALIVSSNSINRNTGRVIVATLSAYAENSEHSIKTFATGRESYINCDRVMCVLTKLLTKYLGSVPKEIMSQVDSALENIFELGYIDEDLETEVERLKKEVTRLEAQLVSKDESIIARGIEIANMNAKYNKAVDRIVELELNMDVAQRIAERRAEPAVETPESIEENKDELPQETAPVVEFQRQMVNINTATGKEIKEKLGVSATVAYSITGYRNKNGRFVEVEELREIPKITKPMFERIKDYCIIDEVEETSVVIEEPSEEVPEQEEKKNNEKVNVNTASLYELMAVGFAKEVAAHIVSFRKNYSLFKTIDDLSRVDGVKAKDIRKFCDKLEV